jgi:hypothetical protein
MSFESAIIQKQTLWGKCVDLYVHKCMQACKKKRDSLRQPEAFDVSKWIQNIASQG